jgi:PKD repeat protein
MADVRVCRALILLLLVGLVLAIPATAGSSVTIKKLASDGKTVIDQKTVTYQWLRDESGLAVWGDGVTNYWAQGPVFLDDPDPAVEAELRWNADENKNTGESSPPESYTKNWGAVKGTNVKDLCDLVGGMNAGETAFIAGTDNVGRTFAYQNIYEYSPVEGPMVLTWYKNGLYPDTGYDEGMRLIWFADDSVNPWHYHIFGNYDWKLAADPAYYYYYQQTNLDGTIEYYPTTTGLSVKWIGSVAIYSDDPVPLPVAQFSATPLTGNAPLTVQFTDLSTAMENPATTSWSWQFGDGETSTAQSPSHTYNVANTYTVTLTVTNSAGSDSETTVITVTSGPVMTVLYDGTVTLTPDTTFPVQAYNNVTGLYTVSRTTPLGALDKAATTAGFTYNISDKNYWAGTTPFYRTLLLDDIDGFLYKKPNYWYAYVNDVFKDGFNNPSAGLNLIQLATGDRVEFYYTSKFPDPANLVAIKANATAAVKTVAQIGTTPPASDWSIQMIGARTQEVTKSYFEDGMAHAPDTHYKEFTDDYGTWSGMPLYLLLGMVDDNPDPGTPYHYNFNEQLANLHYQVKITAGDTYEVVLNSEDIAATKDGYIVANKLDDEYLPATIGDKAKPSWPLHLRGTGVAGTGNTIGNITKIELISIPTPSTGWKLNITGDISDVITQAEFEEAVSHGHTASWSDGTNVYSGVPLWYLVGVADDLESENHWTFNDTRADMNYDVKVIAPSDGFTATFQSILIARNDNYIVANKMNGADLPEAKYPLAMVGINVTKGGQKVSKIGTIQIPAFQTPAPALGSYTLNLAGKISDVISQAEFEAAVNCPQHQRTVTVGTDQYRGIPLWFLAGWVDDRIPHGTDGFNNAQAVAGYKITVADTDSSSPYQKIFDSALVAGSDNYIVANLKSSDGGATFVPLAEDEWPLRIVGAGAMGGYSVSKIDTITLSDFAVPTEIPKLHIVKYASDGTTIITERTVDYVWMKTNLPVIGGETGTHYRFQGLTLDPADLWDPTETKGMNPAKIDNVVKGTRVRDLANLVGGMEAGAEVKINASDGVYTLLNYNNIYPNPYVYSHQGEAIIAWWGDGQYVPKYSDGMRLFFTPEDGVFGQWDMHEAMEEKYWHWRTENGVNYPSAAGLSTKWVTEIDIYSTPATDWTLNLDGTRLGGLAATIGRIYFEQALACQFGANHGVSYNDGTSEWKGMPLWFLAGYVDDADQHSSNSYNEALANAGYDIVVIGSGGYTKIFDSRLTIRSNNYIAALFKDGIRIPDTDTKNWPLKLIGANATGKNSVGGIHQIILNYPPVPASITVPSPVDVGSTVDASGTFTEADLDSVHMVMWVWGDGSPTTAGTVTAKSVAGSHVYTVPGTYSVNFTVTDGPGSSRTSNAATVTVNNVLPVVTSVVVPTTPVLTGIAMTASGSFTDVLDTHTATWAWGDGSTSPGTVDEIGKKVTGTHAYTTPGLFTVSLTLTDGSGATATKSSQYVVVYDPKSGFVTGLGSMNSPKGAFMANPTLTGPATIELLARYPVVINKPFTGVTAFQFLKGKLAFTSTSYDWLVIQKEAKKAFYKGSGKIGGTGDYAFLVSVIDGGSKPALDKFRIKIWNKATGAVVYDTQPGALDTADPTTPLTLGGVVVDKLLN